jgi:N-acetylneuraminate synthase
MNKRSGIFGTRLEEAEKQTIFMRNSIEKEIFAIAEIGQAHEGSLGMAHSYIDALATTGINAIKFQVHIASAESSIHEPFRSNFAYEDPNRMAYWKRMEFSVTQWAELKAHCEDRKLEFIASPFSIAAVDLLEKIGCDHFKIGSGEVNNLLLLKRTAKSAKQITLSSGMSSLDELDQAVNFLKDKCEISILQCTSAYPTGPHQWGLNVIPILKKRYSAPVGFSDHSGDIFACLAAASFGAEMLEFHVAFDQRMFGPDATSSLTIDQVSHLVKGVRQIQTALSHPVDKADNAEFETLKMIFGKSLAVNKALQKGHILSIDELETKKPAGYGIPAAHFESVIGRALKHNLSQWDFLKTSDLA